MSEAIRITFHGHSCFLIEHQEASILIDPFLTGNPVAVIGPEEIDPTHIVVTHGHGDHLGDTVAIAERTNAEVITGFELANHLGANGVARVTDLGIGGGRDFSFGRVTLTIAHHGGALPDGSCGGAPAGAIVGIGGREIYHAGDTALTYDMRLIAELHDIAVAMVPIGDVYTMGPRAGAKAIAFVDADVAVPMHYNTFEALEVDTELFRKGVEALGKTVQMPRPGESFTIDAA